MADLTIGEPGMQLTSAISEEDRTFFMVLDIKFNEQPKSADLGYYYEAECEEAFSFNRFQVASEFFLFYRCHQALKANQRVLVKYVNMAGIMNNRNHQTPNMANVIREFDLIRNYTGNGLVNVFLIFSRAPNIFYLFMEIPNETLEEFLFRHTNNTFQYNSRKARSFGLVNKIRVQDAKFIAKSMANTLLEMHKAGIFHGKLSTNSVFLFRKETIRPSNNSKEGEEDSIVIKLANLAFATVFDRSQQQQDEQQQQQQPRQQQQHNCVQQTNQQQIVAEDKLRTHDLICLYNIVVRIVELTEFPTFLERERFLELARILVMSEPVSADVPVDGYIESNTNNVWLEQSVINLVACQPDIRLETFLEFLWVD